MRKPEFSATDELCKCVVWLNVSGMERTRIRSACDSRDEMHFSVSIGKTTMIQFTS